MDQIWEYRIEYRHRDEEGADSLGSTSFHYYNAESASEAFEYHQFTISKKSWDVNILKVERRCPYADKWIDETDLINPKLSEDKMETLLNEVREQFSPEK